MGSVSQIRGAGGAMRKVTERDLDAANAVREAELDAVIRLNRELSDAINSGEPLPACTDEQRDAARKVTDWLTEHPLTCVALAVGVIALTVLLSQLYPNPWWMP